MSNVILCAEGIHKNFGPVAALTDAKLSLRAGEIHAVMGENGAGKSTLIKILTGVHTFDSGNLKLDGQKILPGTPREAERAGISTVYQEVNLIPDLSVSDNILLGRQPTRFGILLKGQMRERAAKALNRLGLDIDVTRPLKEYSLAIQQLVAIARALDVQARVLILDEPTSSLDAAEVRFLFDVLRRLRSENLAILLVTHFLDQVYAISDRITVLRNGQFVGEYETAALSRLDLISAMIGRNPSELTTASAPAVAGDSTAKAVTLSAKDLGRRNWISPINLELRAGEILGLSGLLGSGRTEIAKMLFGVMPADSGEMKIRGKIIRTRSPREALQQGLTYCSEDRRAEGILPNLSVRENLIITMQASRGAARLIPRAEQNALAQHYIQALNIKTHSAETPISNLSGGNQQKILLARCLLLQPQIILLDEPTRGIDVGAKAEIETLIHTLRDRGLSVLLISSDLEEIERNCDRVMVLHDRRIAGELSGGDIKPESILRMIANA